MKPEILQQTLTAYQLHREMSHTAYFSVFSATRIADNRSVLLLILNPDLPRDAYFVRRFKDMVERNTTLDHPHILPALGYETVDDLLLCVCDFPGGESLDEYLAAHEPLLVAETMTVVREIATALDYAHGQAVRHGSLSGQTVFVCDGQTFVAFFGLAQLLEEIAQVKDAARITDDRYLSPERLSGESASRTGDLYALGVLTYRMLTGEMPFSADDPARHREPPAPPHTRNSNVRPATSEVVLRMLSRGVELRQTTGAEFIRALQVAIEGSAPLRPITAATAAIKPEKRPVAPRFSGKLIAVVAFAVTVIVLGLAGGFWLMSNWGNLRPVVAPNPTSTATIAPTATPIPPTIPAPKPLPSPTAAEATPTATTVPAAQPGATIAPNSPFSQLVLASGITDTYQPQNPATVFGADTKTIYLFFRYAGISAGTPWQVEWRFNGSTIETGSDRWPADYGSAGTAWVFYTPIDGFSPGQYTVSLAIDGETVATAAFQIQ